ncbi:hypothetical protein O6072_06565 [Mycolicibacterium neoaurum]|uniref:hypothetical protein n=1 Tax=Mycolicibacterium neoaurum TaxID=1795 RepID=UPI00248AA06A|nr:hypothetical protein [Mycolicibacterium neoaurum]WBP95840.1 hypothetical protein O7W24_06570 [Mycolicibacterium neoaurum]WBS09525.1 hypothetical protein O6072_06565 [Mycolicibacterium neoaurum]
MASADQERLALDIDFSRRLQRFCAWCGPAFVLLLFGGWGVLGGFIPLIPAYFEPHQVAQAYAENVNLHRLGTLLGLIGIFLTIPFFFVISMQIRRTELRFPSLAVLQFTSGIIVTVVLIIPELLFIGGLFRPDRPAELTQLVNDLSYVMLILPWPPIFGQLFALAAAIFRDESPHPVFPRWLAYFNLWVAFLLLPASLIIFFKSGPFAWTGLIGFWLPAAAFGIWYLVMTVVVLRAIEDEARRDLASMA